MGVHSGAFEAAKGFAEFVAVPEGDVHPASRATLVSSWGKLWDSIDLPIGRQGLRWRLNLSFDEALVGVLTKALRKLGSRSNSYGDIRFIVIREYLI